MSLRPGVLLDRPGLGLSPLLPPTPDSPGHSYGECLLQPPLAVTPGHTVSAKFVSGGATTPTPTSGHLRNNLMLEDTFLTVEVLEAEGWRVVARDADWETKLLWARTSSMGTSTVEVVWEVPSDVQLGTYRLGHQGFHRALFRWATRQEHNIHVIHFQRCGAL